MANNLSPSAQKVQDTLQAMGFQNQVIEQEHTTHSAKEAAEAIGCSLAQIAKSLIFRTRASGRPILVITSGINRVNEAILGGILGEPVEKATVDFVESTTGFPVGGVPPLGHQSLITTFIDEALTKHEEIWAAAGTPNAVFKVSPAELLQMTGGQVIAVK